MKGLSLRSRAGSLVCPLCEGHKLKARGHNSARCDSCGGIVSGATLEALRQITALPDALGSHACECGSRDAAAARWSVPLLGLWLGGTSARSLGKVAMQVVSSKAEIFDGRTLGRHATEGRDQCIRKSAFAPTSAAPRECRTHRGALERHSSLLPKGRYKIGSS
jgi:hypothetical protein